MHAEDRATDEVMQDRELRTADLAETRGDAPAGAPHAGGGVSAGAAETEPLLPAEESELLRSRWEVIQTGFVDEPRRAVEEADQLVAEVMQRLARGFSEARSGLESQWDERGDVSTEDLRVALRRYRSFFQRLMAA